MVCHVDRCREMRFVEAQHRHSAVGMERGETTEDVQLAHVVDEYQPLLTRLGLGLCLRGARWALVVVVQARHPSTHSDIGA